jgi:iron complex outermembrane receptor protein
VLLDAMLRLDQGHWRYALHVSNLANRRSTSCLAEPTLTCFWAEERTAVLSARYRW